MIDMVALLQVAGVLACLGLIAVYFWVRHSGEWALDGFMLFFLVQYGPHGLWLSSYHRVATMVTRDETESYLISMVLAYLFTAIGLLVFSNLRLDALARQKFPIVVPGDVVLIVVTLLYLIPFIVVQGPSLPITSEYLRAFLGKSSYEYDELRRELFAGSAYERLSSLTRQSFTAILMSYHFYRLIKFPLSRLVLLPFSILLFIIAALQMNKFPLVYYFILFFISYLAVQREKQELSFSFKKYGILIFAAAVALVILNLLYVFQYGREALEMREVMVYRIFYCSADCLRLWFGYFPGAEDFLGVRGIPITAKIFGTDYVNPTLAVPESLSTGRLTSFQCGFIGSGYAVGGLVGVVIYSFIAGGIAMTMTKLQVAFKGDTGATCFLSMLTLNSIFLTTRELHTAMLSGGTVSVMILFLVVLSFNKLLVRRSIEA